MKRYLSEKQRYVESNGKDEHYLVIPGERTGSWHGERTHVYTVASPRVDRTSRYRILWNLRQVRLLLEKIQPDVIEVGDPYQLAWAALATGARLGCPVVGFYHSHFPDAYLRTLARYGGRWAERVAFAGARLYIRELYRRFGFTLVASHRLYQLLRDWGVANVVRIPLGVDTEVFCPSGKDWEWRKTCGVPRDAFLLLYVGRLSREKNIGTLLSAFARLRKGGQRQLWLLVIGDGPLRFRVAQTAREVGGLVWVEYVESKEELARYYRCADLFVHPGIVETFGLVALESQACGCPVIGIRGTQMDENILWGLEYWADANSPDSLAEAILGARRVDLSLWGQRVAREVLQHYTWKHTFGRLWQTYRKALGQEDPSSSCATKTSFVR